MQNFYKRHLFSDEGKLGKANRFLILHLSMLEKDLYHEVLSMVLPV